MEMVVNNAETGWIHARPVWLISVRKVCGSIIITKLNLSTCFGTGGDKGSGVGTIFNIASKFNSLDAYYRSLSLSDSE